MSPCSQRFGTSHRWMLAGAVLGVGAWVWFQVWLWWGLGDGDFSGGDYSGAEWIWFAMLMAIWASLWAIAGALVGLVAGAVFRGLANLLYPARNGGSDASN